VAVELTASPTGVHDTRPIVAVTVFVARSMTETDGGVTLLTYANGAAAAGRNALAQATIAVATTRIIVIFFTPQVGRVPDSGAAAADYTSAAPGRSTRPRASRRS
jgi:hypothetical protein